MGKKHMEQKDSTTKENATRKVTVRLTATEYKWLEAAFSSTTANKLSQYVRAILLRKPVTVYTRNKSKDNFVFEMVKLRTELAAIGNNFNQAVKRLHSFSYLAEVKKWAEQTERMQAELIEKTVEIDNRIAQITDSW